MTHTTHIENDSTLIIKVNASGTPSDALAGVKQLFDPELGEGWMKQYAILSNQTRQAAIDIETLAKEHAVDLVFGLESEDRNIDASAELASALIFDAVQMSSSLTINVDGVEYDLETYVPNMPDEMALEILEDAKNNAISMASSVLAGVLTGETEVKSAKDTGFDIESTPLFKNCLNDCIKLLEDAAGKEKLSPKGIAITPDFCDVDGIDLTHVKRRIVELASLFDCADDDSNFRFVVNALCGELTSHFKLDA